MKKLLKIFLWLLGAVAAAAAAGGAIAFVKERLEEKKDLAAARRKGFYERFVKRPLDCALSLGALLVFSPVLLLAALAVRIKLGSPVLFTQARPGLGEKIFRLYKFRSMSDERDENGELLPDSVRLTKFGRILRATSLDELPELWNIVRGDMSLVGPRPLSVKYIPYYTPEEHHRHDVRPGLTGLAQVNGRNNLPWEERFALDLRYAGNITFRGDWEIVKKTVGKVFRRADVTTRGQGKVEDLDDLRQRLMDEGKWPPARENA